MADSIKCFKVSEKNLVRLIFVCFLYSTIFISSDKFNDPHVQPKYYFFIVGVICLSFFAIVRKISRYTLRLDGITILVVLSCSYFTARGLLSHITMHVFFPITAFVLYFFFLHRHSKLFFNITIVSACVIESLWAILEFANVIPRESSYYITGSFDNPAGLAAFLSMGFPFCLSLPKRTLLYKYFRFFACVLLTVAVILSQSRAGVIAIIAIVIFYALSYYNYYLVKYKTRVIFISFFVLTILSIGLFSIKKDSALGRMLIWKVTCQMIVDNPIYGSGAGAHMGNYMEYQANYFEQHNESGYASLADNNKYAFNEYLRITAEYGVVGILLILLLLLIAFRSVNNGNEYYKMALIALSVFSLFSYPLRYPPVWILAVYCLATLSTGLHKKSISINYYFVSISLIIFIGVCGTFVFKDYSFELKWQSLYKKSLQGYTKAVINDYEILYNEWNGNPFFLYNYSAELNIIDDYDKSLAVLHRCELYYNDFYVQILMADNYFAKKEWGKAEQHYKKASYMCPNKFRPLQGLLHTFIAADQLDAAKSIAEEITSKKVKVPSLNIALIKHEAKKLLSNSD